MGSADWTWRGCEQHLRKRKGRRGGGDGDRDGLNWWNDNVANIILVMEVNAPLAYDTGLELRHPIMAMATFVRNLGRLKIEREIDCTIDPLMYFWVNNS